MGKKTPTTEGQRHGGEPGMDWRAADCGRRREEHASPSSRGCRREPARIYILFHFVFSFEASGGVSRGVGGHTWALGGQGSVLPFRDYSHGHGAEGLEETEI